MYHFVEISQSNAVIKSLMEQGRKRFEAVENGVPFSPEIIDTSGLSIDGGIAVSYERSKFRESVACITDDVHILIIGATRSGKTRCLVIQSICALALAAEGMVVNDPKGELYHYTHSFLESMGYMVQVVDFNNPKKSCRYNPLQMIIDAVNENRIDDAQTYTWDFVTFLVEKNDHSEPIWSNGEMSVIAAAVMCVVYDNRDRPEYQNLTNVYNFIANMCKPVNKVLPIDAYMDKLPDSHPAKKLMAIAKLAPDKMGGSFYTAALTTLRLFITNDIYNMTKESEFSLSDVGAKLKQALFFILPDQKTTYVLWTDGDPDADPFLLLTNFVRAVGTALIFQWLYGLFVDICREITNTIISQINGGTDMTTEWVTAITSMGIVPAIAGLIFVICWLILYFSFMARGIEMMVMQIGVPLACVGLLDNDKGVFRAYINQFVKAFVTTIVQIMLCKIGLSLMLNATIISASNIFWGIACMIAAISMPKILREFLVPTTGDGRIGTTVSQTVHIASMAKNIIAK